MCRKGRSHLVAIKPLWVGKCEVTWAEYDLFWEKKANEKPPLTDSDKKADATPPGRRRRIITTSIGAMAEARITG